MAAYRWILHGQSAPTGLALDFPKDRMSAARTVERDVIPKGIAEKPVSSFVNELKVCDPRQNPLP